MEEKKFEKDKEIEEKYYKAYNDGKELAIIELQKKLDNNHKSKWSKFWLGYTLTEREKLLIKLGYDKGWNKGCRYVCDRLK